MNTTSGLVSKQIVFFTHILLDILNKHNKQKACENLCGHGSTSFLPV